jgi:hypothetical protein
VAVVMYPKEFIAGLREIKHDLSGEAELRKFLAGWFERATLPDFDDYLTRHLPQLLTDAWEDLRTARDPMTEQACERIAQHGGYEFLPDILGFFPNPPVWHRSLIRQLLIAIISDVYRPKGDAAVVSVAGDLMTYFTAQETILLQTLHGFIRKVWRRGLYDLVRYRRTAKVYVGFAAIHTAVMADNMSLAFIRGRQEVHFVGGPDDPLGLQFTFAGVSEGMNLEKARAIILKVTEMGTSLIERSPGKKVFHVEKVEKE